MARFREFVKGLGHRPRLVLGALVVLTLLAHVRWFMYSGAGLKGYDGQYPTIWETAFSPSQGLIFWTPAASQPAEPPDRIP